MIAALMAAVLAATASTAPLAELQTDLVYVRVDKIKAANATSTSDLTVTLRANAPGVPIRCLYAVHDFTVDVFDEDGARVKQKRLLLILSHVTSDRPKCTSDVAGDENTLILPLRLMCEFEHAGAYWVTIHILPEANLTTQGLTLKPIRIEVPVEDVTRQ